MLLPAKPLHLPILPAARPDCTLCSLSSSGARSIGIPTCHIRNSLPLSRSTPCVLFLGQNPGFNEDREGIPFIGKSGEVVQRSFIPGISLQTMASVFVGNTARCYHVDGDGPSNKHYKVCREHLIPDLHALVANSSELIVVTLGAPAASHLYALLGVPKVNLTSAFSRQGTRLPLPSEEPTACGVSGTAGKKSKRKSAKSLVTAGEPSLFSLISDTATSAKSSSTSAAAAESHAPPNNGRGKEVMIFSTYHPAAVLRTNNLIHACAGHLQLLLNHLTGHTPVPSSPHFIPPRNPRS